MGFSDVIEAGKKALAKNKPSEEELKALVKEYARAWWDEKEAKERKDKIKKRILELGVDKIAGDEGILKVTETKDSFGIIGKHAKEFLSEEQIEMCTGVTRRGFTMVKFTPGLVRPRDDE